MANLRTTIILDAKTRVKGAFDKTKGHFNGLRSNTNRANTEMGTLGRTARRLQTTLLGFVGINILSNVAQSVIRVSDNMKLMQGRLQVVTGSIAGAVDASKKLVAVSLQTGTSLASNTSLFVRLNRPLKAMGKNAEFATKFVGFMAKGLRVSGASAGEAASVIRQMSQALASGVLRGDEFNSVSENGTAITIALGESLNKTQGELRDMAEEGLLTSEVVIDALSEQFESMDSQFANIPKTVDASVEKVKTSFSVMVGASEGVNSATDKLIGGLEFLSANMSQITAIGVTLAQVLGTTLLGSITTLTAAKIKQSVASEKLAAAERQYQTVAGMSAIKAKEFAVAMAKTKAAIDSNITAVQSNIKSLSQNINVERLAAKVTERRIQVKLKEAAALTKVATNLERHNLLIRKEAAAGSQLIKVDTQLAEVKRKLEIIRSQSLRNGSATQAQTEALNRLLNNERVLTDQLTASKLRLNSAQNGVTASSASAAAAIRNQNDISRRHQVSLQNLNAVTSRNAVSQGFFARNLASTGVALRNVGVAARVGAAGMLAFTKTIAVGTITFEAIIAVYELSTAFLTLSTSAKKVEQADKDLAIQLEQNIINLEKEAEKYNIVTESVRDNFGKITKLVAAKKQEVKQNKINAELEVLRIARNRTLLEGTNELTLGQFKLNTALVRGETSMLKIKKATSDTLDTFKKWHKEVGGNLDAIKDKLNGLSDLEFAKFEKSVLDSMNAGIEVTKEMQRVMDSLSLSKTERAFRALGLIADTELKRIAETHQKAFDTVVESGVATEAQLSEAFTKLAEKLIEANGGVADAALIAEAKVRNVTIKINESGKASVLTSEQLTQMGTAGEDAGNKMGTALSKPTESLHKLRIKVRKAREDYKTLLNSGSATAEGLRIAWQKVQNSTNAVSQSLGNVGSEGKKAGSKIKTSTVSVTKSTNKLLEKLKKAKLAYEKLKNSGTASLEELKKATNKVESAQNKLNSSIDKGGSSGSGSGSSSGSGSGSGGSGGNASGINNRSGSGGNNNGGNSTRRSGVNSERRAQDIKDRNNANIEKTDASGRRANKEIFRKFSEEQKKGYDQLTALQKEEINYQVRRGSLNQALNIAAERQNKGLRDQIIDSFLARAEQKRQAEADTQAGIERRTEEKAEHEAKLAQKKEIRVKEGEQALTRLREEQAEFVKVRQDKKDEKIKLRDEKIKVRQAEREAEFVKGRAKVQAAKDAELKELNEKKARSKARKLASDILLAKENNEKKVEEEKARVIRQDKIDAVSDAARLIRLNSKNASQEQRDQSKLDVIHFRKRREERRVYEELKKQKQKTIDDETFKQRNDRLQKEKEEDAAERKRKNDLSTLKNKQLAEARKEDLENKNRLQKLNSEIQKSIKHSAKVDSLFFNDLDEILKQRTADTSRIINNLKRGQ